MSILLVGDLYKDAFNIWNYFFGR